MVVIWNGILTSIYVLIQNIHLENILYFDSEPFNKSLTVHFLELVFWILKLMKKGNIHKNITARMEQKEELLVEFGQIHFLNGPSSYSYGFIYTESNVVQRTRKRSLE